MEHQAPTDSTEAFERLLTEPPGEVYTLRLYITGASPKSRRAIANLRAICDEYLEGRYQLEVIDIHQQPTLARGEQIVAVPTLIRQLPRPLRRLVGDLSNKERVLIGLDLRRER